MRPTSFMRPSLPPPRPARQPDFSLATVNIVLLLVLFFLVVGSPAGEAERAVTLPETRTLPLDALPRPLLALAPGGAMELDGAPIDAAGLVARIEGGNGDGTRDGTGAGMGDEPLTALHLLVPRDLAALELLALSDLIAGAGAQVVLVTLRQGVSLAEHGAGNSAGDITEPAAPGPATPGSGP